MQKGRIVVLFVLFSIMWVALLLRAINLQIWPDDRLAGLQKKQFRTVIELPARRGHLFDREGKELAVSIPAHSLFADPKMIKNIRAWAKALSPHVAYSSEGLIKKIKAAQSKRFVWIERQMSDTAKQNILKLKLTGIGFVEEPKRVYPNNALLSQVIGFIGREGQGLEGLEKKFDKELRGEKLSFKMERDARGRPLIIDGRIFTQAPSGADLGLTVDSEIQFVLEKALYDAVVTHNADSAMGVILDAKTAEVIAIGYAPTFDLNRAQNYSTNFWRNRVVQDVYEPGSVVKPLVVAGALREGLIKPSTVINCENGKFQVGDRIVREADTRHSFDHLSVSDIIAKSSNIGTAKIALNMGAEKLRNTLSLFGLGETLSEDFLGEAKGILQPLPWNKHLQATTSFGHGVAATPLQLAAAYAAIANGGVLYRPYIVKSIRSWETGEEKVFKPTALRRVLTPSEAATMRIILHQATEAGSTGVRAQVSGFPVAGKTGTAQKVSKTGGYTKGEYISSFAGMIPANDPRFVIYVAVDNPREKYYGSEVAAPLFARVAGFAVRKSGLAPVTISKKDILPKEVHEKTNSAVKRIQETALVLNQADLNKTPDFTGLTLREVYQRLKGTDLEVKIKGRGRVAEMLPAPGDDLPESKTLRLILKE